MLAIRPFLHPLLALHHHPPNVHILTIWNFFPMPSYQCHPLLPHRPWGATIHSHHKSKAHFTPIKQKPNRGNMKPQEPSKLNG